MKKLIAVTTVAIFATSANAGQNCKGSVVLNGKSCQQQSHVTYITTAGPVAAHPAAKADIVDTAVGAGSFNTLMAAVQAGGLVNSLKGEGPFTVFAPTDEAFAKLPEGTVANLLQPENQDQLVAILTYHVVAGKVVASDVIKLSTAKTVNGKSATVKVSDAGVMIDDAKVVATDIEASNGVIDSFIAP